MKIIFTEKAAPAIGAYSQAIVVNGIVYTSGQIPILPNGDFLDSNVKDQTHQVCKNLREVLKEAGSNLENVIKTTVFITDINYFSDFNEVYAEYFVNKPSRSAVVVKELPKGSKIEIECIAKVIL